MENFVPNIVLIDYLTATEQLTPAIEQKVKEHLKLGYQSQLNFLHDDGSFSVFGKNDRKGSVWVTTYVTKSLIEANKYTSIDEAIISKALNWLCIHQRPDGRFVETGFMYYSEMQSSVDGGAALTAYTLVTLLQYPHKTEMIDRAIEKATEFLRRGITAINTYTLSLVTYALALKNDSLKDTAANLLDSKVSITPTGLKYWSKSKDRPDSVSVEMTGYVLLAYVALGREEEAEPIFKWLMKQRKRDGGFASYQDTVIGIEALAKLAAKFYSKTPLLEIAVTHGDNKPETFAINHQNSLQPIIYELPPNTNNVGLSAQGSGLAIFNVATEYSTYNKMEDSAAFDLVVTVVSKIPAKHLVLNVCASFKATAYSAMSNTASIEITFPSGYTFNHASKSALERIARVRRHFFCFTLRFLIFFCFQLVEVKEKNTVVVLHFASFGRKTTCFAIDANQTAIVRRLKPAYATISDNYESGKSFDLC
jgi:CD109 antigen